MLQMFVWSLSLYNIIEFKVPFFYAKSRTCSFIVNINNIYDKNLENILLDYKFEFYAAELTLEEPYDKEHFWNSFDAIKQDLINYIDNWIDISYYNYYKFKPYNFNDDKTEIVNAIIISQQNAKNFQNRTYARK